METCVITKRFPPKDLRMGDEDEAEVLTKFVADYFAYVADSGDQIRSLSAMQTPASGVKLVANYLPQFHPIEENNQWWGNGFTEWTNVTRAVPQFVGHYQPRLPAELGFYDLRVPEVQERQVALAKQAGISAFAFYFYWFSGKTLLETPIRNFAENNNIDFEFCLCWANDDWSRTWGGNSDDILIQQSFDPDDDIAFISHLAQYLRNRKYLRVDGKPLITVWRPTLLPDAAATVQRWRDWCMQHGIGPIHVCCAQTYERLAPAEHGMDSAYQNPPSDSRWIEPNIDQFAGPVNWLNKNFEGQLFDYRKLVRRAQEFIQPDYPLFRGVCPSWDNEARRPGKGRVLVGADPKGYLEYLETVLDQTIQAEPDPARRLVFINGWNEWGEGAYLEPDARFGFGNLEATKMASLRSALRHGRIEEPERLAIVIHVYYTDLIEECLGWLQGLTIPHDVFITTSEDKRPDVEAFIAGREFSASVVTTENRGRDVAPFLHVLRSLDFRRYGRILKLHAKSSQNGRHRWRKGLFGALADEKSLKRALGFFETDPEIGILGPSKYLLSMGPFLGRNEHAVRRLAERMGVTDIDPAADTFFAGTMFLARTKALLPLGALGFVPEDFEPEQGQSNGTLAHAVERAVTYSAKAAGLRVAAFDENVTGRRGAIYDGHPTFPYVESASRSNKHGDDRAGAASETAN
jgi:lipopolysaccharide biosynthesis protein